MPAVTQEKQTIVHAGKKRRRDDIPLSLDAQHSNTTPLLGSTTFPRDTPSSHHPTSYFLHSPAHQHFPQHQSHGFAAAPAVNHGYISPPQRKLMAFPTIKRIKPTLEDEENREERPHPRSVSPSQRRSKSPASSHAPQQTDNRPTPTRQNTAPSQLISRCHICNRKPTKKSDLDSFADCEGCRQRTCYVCIRQCLDWRPKEQRRWSGYGSASFHMQDADVVEVARDGEEVRIGSEGKEKEAADGWARGGHRPMVCSRCCVEKGKDGDVVCLGCLPFVEG